MQAALVWEGVDIATPGGQQRRRETGQARKRAVAGGIVGIQQVGANLAQRATQRWGRQQVALWRAPGQPVQRHARVVGVILAGERQDVRVHASIRQAVGPPNRVDAVRGPQERDFHVEILAELAQWKIAAAVLKRIARSPVKLRVRTYCCCNLSFSGRMTSW
ncbi:hypothetical protein D3C86_1296800 [compost metagenome]